MKKKNQDLILGRKECPLNKKGCNGNVCATPRGKEKNPFTSEIICAKSVGREKNCLSGRDSMSSFRATPRGKQRNSLSAKDGMSSLWATT